MSTTVFALAAQQGGGQIQEIARTFGVDWPHLTTQIISFGIVCALLYLLAYQPVLRMLDARRQQIAQGLANTEKINAALASIEAQRQSVMAEAQVQSTRLIADARAVARAPARAGSERATAAAAADRSARRAKPPNRSTHECSPSCGAKSAAWSCRRRPQ